MGRTSRNGEWQCKTGYFTLTLNRDLPGVLSLVIFFYKLQIFDVTKYKVLKYFNLFLMSLKIYVPFIYCNGPIYMYLL